MEITFANRRLERVLSSPRMLQRQYGPRMARVIEDRLDVLRGADSLAMAGLRRDLRLHQLAGNRDEQFAVDLVHPYRLVIQTGNHPVPRNLDGGIDTEQVTAVVILEVVDYH